MAAAAEVEGGIITYQNNVRRGKSIILMLLYEMYNLRIK